MLRLSDPHKLMLRLSGCVSTYAGDVFANDQNELIVASVEMLYGLIHARYILTTKGLAAMLEKARTATLEGAPVYPTLVSPVFQWGSLISLGPVPSTYIVLNGKISTTQDRSTKPNDGSSLTSTTCTGSRPSPAMATADLRP